MPRQKKQNALAEAHRATMEKCPIFELWMVKHLRNRERVKEYKAAFDIVHGKKEAEEEEVVDEQAAD